MSARYLLTYIVYKTLPSILLDIARVVRWNLYQKKRDARNKRVIESLLQRTKPILLELAPGGRKMKGWTTVGLAEASDIRMDLSNPLPLPDNSVTQIYSAHFLEHLHYPDLVNLLCECCRVLQPGGFFKVAVPNARIYIEAYLNPATFDAEYYCRYKPGFQYNSRIDYVNYTAYMGGHHRYMFDEENLPIILTNAGLKSARLREAEPMLDIEARMYESIYAEAVK